MYLHRPADFDTNADTTEQMKRLQRLYRLLMLIRTHDMLAEHLARALECSLSQVEKDIAYLRYIGVHIAYSKIERTYYSKTRPSELIDMFAVMIEQYD